MLSPMTKRRGTPVFQILLIVGFSVLLSISSLILSGLAWSAANASSVTSSTLLGQLQPGEIGHLKVSGSNLLIPTIRETKASKNGISGLRPRDQESGIYFSAHELK